MIGLQSDVVAATRGLRSDANQKSHRFTSSINGRFHVAGMSGSFHKIKLKKMHDEIISNKLNEIKRHNEENPSVPIGDEALKIEEEIQKDEERLLELQRQLEEVKQKRMLKEKRQEERRVKKVIFQAATRIQRGLYQACYYRKWAAANLLRTMLRSRMHRQAVVVGSWAVRIMRRFINTYVWRWAYKRARRLHAKEISGSLWSAVASDTASNVAQRREFCKKFVNVVVARGKRKGVKGVLAKEAELKAQLSYKGRLNMRRSTTFTGLRGSNSPTPDGGSRSPMRSSMIGGADSLQRDSSLDHKRSPVRATILNRTPSDLMRDENARKELEREIAAAEELQRKEEAKAAAAEALFKQNAAAQLAAGTIKRMDGESEVSYLTRLHELHELRKSEMEAERAARLKSIELQKKKAAEAAAIAEQREEAIRREKEKKKAETLARMRAQQQEATREAARIRQEKERAAKEKAAERAKETRECNAMELQDTRVQEQRRREAERKEAKRLEALAAFKAKQQAAIAAGESNASAAAALAAAAAPVPPPPAVPKQDPHAMEILLAKKRAAEEADKKRAEEEAAAKAAARDEAVKKERVALQRRLAERIAKERKAAKEEEEKVKIAKAKQEQVQLLAQIALQQHLLQQHQQNQQQQHPASGGGGGGGAAHRAEGKKKASGVDHGGGGNKKQAELAAALEAKAFLEKVLEQRGYALESDSSPTHKQQKQDQGGFQDEDDVVLQHSSPISSGLPPKALKKSSYTKRDKAKRLEATILRNFREAGIDPSNSTVAKAYLGAVRSNAMDLGKGKKTVSKGVEISAISKSKSNSAGNVQDNAPSSGGAKSSSFLPQIRQGSGSNVSSRGSGADSGGGGRKVSKLHNMIAEARVTSGGLEGENEDYYGNGEEEYEYEGEDAEEEDDDFEDDLAAMMVMAKDEEAERVRQSREQQKTRFGSDDASPTSKSSGIPLGPSAAGDIIAAIKDYPAPPSLQSVLNQSVVVGGMQIGGPGIGVAQPKAVSKKKKINSLNAGAVGGELGGTQHMNKLIAAANSALTPVNNGQHFGEDQKKKKQPQHQPGASVADRVSPIVLPGVQGNNSKKVPGAGINGANLTKADVDAFIASSFGSSSTSKPSLKLPDLDTYFRLGEDTAVYREKHEGDGVTGGSAPAFATASTVFGQRDTDAEEAVVGAKVTTDAGCDAGRVDGSEEDDEEEEYGTDVDWAATGKSGFGGSGAGKAETTKENLPKKVSFPANEPAELPQNNANVPEEANKIDNISLPTPAADGFFRSKKKSYFAGDNNMKSNSGSKTPTTIHANAIGKGNNMSSKPRQLGAAAGNKQANNKMTVLQQKQKSVQQQNQNNGNKKSKGILNSGRHAGNLGNTGPIKLKKGVAGEEIDSDCDSDGDEDGNSKKRNSNITYLGGSQNIVNNPQGNVSHQYPPRLPLDALLGGGNDAVVSTTHSVAGAGSIGSTSASVDSWGNNSVTSMRYHQTDDEISVGYGGGPVFDGGSEGANGAIMQLMNRLMEQSKEEQGYAGSEMAGEGTIGAGYDVEDDEDEDDDEDDYEAALSFQQNSQAKQGKQKSTKGYNNPRREGRGRVQKQKDSLPSSAGELKQLESALDIECMNLQQKLATKMMLRSSAGGTGGFGGDQSANEGDEEGEGEGEEDSYEDGDDEYAEDE